MIPIPLSLAGSALALAVGGLLIVYEGVPLIIDGRVDRAYTAGQMAERQAWEELRRKEMAAREVERREAQEEIDSIESEYWRQTQTQKFRISELEKALETEPAADPACACPPAVSKRLRDALNGVGR